MKNGICFLGLPRYATTTVGAVIASEAKQSTVRLAWIATALRAWK